MELKYQERMNKMNKVIPMCVILAVFFPIITFAGEKSLEEEKQNKVVAEWNDKRIAFNNTESERKAIEALPEWVSQPMLWPENSDILQHKAVVTEKQKTNCITRLREFMKDEWIPNNIGQYLVPMENWAKSDEYWKEKNRKADVFIVNYKIDNYLIYIVEGKDMVTVSIKETDIKSTVSEDEYTGFIFNIAQKFLVKDILPKSKNEIKWFKRKGEEPNNGNWLCSSVKVVIDSKGRKAIPTKDAAKIGAMNVRFYTDGKFVQFVILSDFQAFLNPYQPRFSDAQKSK